MTRPCKCGRKPACLEMDLLVVKTGFKESSVCCSDDVYIEEEVVKSQTSKINKTQANPKMYLT